MIPLDPSHAEFLLVSFEGPDAYAQAGGLGVRMTGLSEALVARGFGTHFVFFGDPNLDPIEERGALRLFRWGQHICARFPLGVYHGEYEKRDYLQATLPEFVTQLMSDLVAQGKRLVILAEDWQTVPALLETSDRLWKHGLRAHATLIWNANNTIGFDTIQWPRLQYVSQLTTVSRFMKHTMWNYAVNPTVIPNGIPDEAFEPRSPNQKNPLLSLYADLTLVKVARFDPDKRWTMAIDALALLKASGVRARAIVRGGIEGYGDEVRQRARSRGLTWESVAYRLGFEEDLAASSADILEVSNRIPDSVLRSLYHHADAVLANSGMEPFGLVGLEVMAQGGVAITGATGEDYAIPYYNALVVDTDNPEELMHHGMLLIEDPTIAKRIRAHGPETAQQYRWQVVLDGLLYRIQDFQTHWK